MQLNETELKSLHRLSFGNEERVKRGEIAGCFDCLKIFSTKRIKNWYPDTPLKTAACPECDTDSVIVQDETVSVTDEMLYQMRGRWFPCSEIYEKLEKMPWLNKDDLIEEMRSRGVTCKRVYV